MELRERIEQLFDNSPEEFTGEHYELFEEFKQQLNTGRARAAEKIDGQWRITSSKLTRLRTDIFNPLFSVRISDRLGRAAGRLAKR